MEDKNFATGRTDLHGQRFPAAPPKGGKPSAHGAIPVYPIASEDQEPAGVYERLRGTRMWVVPHSPSPANSRPPNRKRRD